MSENVLKKDFKQKDVQRLRNLVQGKYGERTTVGIGYEKKKSFVRVFFILKQKIQFNKFIAFIIKN